MTYQLPQLSYKYSDLEPYFDAQTMEIHHSKHHQTYVDKLNAALTSANVSTDQPVEDLLKNLKTLPENIQTAVKNMGGGHANHSLFWKIIGPKSLQDAPSGKLEEALNGSFGSVANFKDQFSQAALGLFGSGWVWLIENHNKLELLSTPNQDSPYLDGKMPVMGLDVWEHAYYLKYQNRRADYIAAWWQVVNWKEVENIFNVDLGNK